HTRSKRDWSSDVCSSDLQFVLDLPIRGRSHPGSEVPAPPFGRFFSYCTGGVFVLSEVIENTTRVRADRYAQARLFDPLGIRNVRSEERRVGKETSSRHRP